MFLYSLLSLTRLLLCFGINAILSAKIEFFHLSPCKSEKMPIFAPPSREKTAWPEKAHSSLCSSEVNLDNSQRYMRDDEMRRLSLFNVCVFNNTLHKQWSLPYPLFLYTGSPDPTSENKDKFGRLRSVCHSVTPSFEPWAQTKTNQNGKRRKQKSSRKKRVLQGSRKEGAASPRCGGFDEQSCDCKSGRKRIVRMRRSLPKDLYSNMCL